jgi:uncharacterized protein YciI
MRYIAEAAAVNASARYPLHSTIMKYVLLYNSTPDFMEKVPQHLEAHQALWRTFHADKRLLMVGPFNDPPLGDAMAVFATRDAAEEFVSLDPFVAHGIVAQWTIREWNEVLMP